MCVYIRYMDIRFVLFADDAEDDEQDSRGMAPDAIYTKICPSSTDWNVETTATCADPSSANAKLK